MSQYATRTIRLAFVGALLAASTAQAGEAPAPNTHGTATALAALARTPQAAPGTFTDHVAAVLKTRHDTAKNSVGNIR